MYKKLSRCSITTNSTNFRWNIGHSALIYIFFVFQKKNSIPIEQLKTPPKNLNIYNLKEKKVIKLLKIFLEMPNVDKKMILYTLP